MTESLDLEPIKARLGPDGYPNGMRWYAAEADLAALIAEVERLREEKEQIVEDLRRRTAWTLFACGQGPMPNS